RHRRGVSPVSPVLRSHRGQRNPAALLAVPGVPGVPGGNERGKGKMRSLAPLIARLRAAPPLPLFPETGGGEGAIPRARKEEGDGDTRGQPLGRRGLSALAQRNAGGSAGVSKAFR